MKDKPSTLDDGTISDVPTPGLWKLDAAALRAGLAVETFCRGSADGSIPVEIVRIGKRGLRYVRASELEAFLKGNPTK